MTRTEQIKAVEKILLKSYLFCSKMDALDEMECATAIVDSLGVDKARVVAVLEAIAMTHRLEDKDFPSPEDFAGELTTDIITVGEK